MSANAEMHSAEAGDTMLADRQDDKARSRRVAGQDPAKRKQIIEGAKRCFMQMGFEAASMNDITAEAGVSKGTLYVYFADKEDLFAALCEQERTRHLLFAQSQLDEAASTEEALRGFGIALATRLTSTEAIRAMRMVLAVTERMPKLSQRFFGNEPFSGLTMIKSFLDRKVAAGELRIDDTELAGRQFIDLAMAGVFKRRLFGNLPDEVAAADIARMVEIAVAMFLGFYRVK
jgi:AcrR family transcriptional regulator